MLENILFDLDGTLTDPFEGITNSVLYALKKMGIEEQDRGKLAVFIGPPLIASFRDFYGMTPEDARRAVGFYREYYSERGIFENAVIEGIPELLKALKGRGLRLFVATSKPELFAERIISHFSLDKFIASVFGASLDETRTEKGAVIAYALKEGNIPPETALMAGDRKHDILGAKENKIASMGVLFGFGSREELVSAGADYIASTPQEALEIIEKITADGRTK